MRKTVNVYAGVPHHINEAQNARKVISESYAGILQKFAGIDKQLPKIFETVENKFIHKVDRLSDTDIYPIGQIWNDMVECEASIRKTLQEISKLKEDLAKTPSSKSLKETIAAKEQALKELKDDWVEGLRASVKYEGLNRKRMEKANRIPEYDYLTGENKTIKKHKQIFDTYKNNDNSIPDKLWDDIVAS